MGIDLERCPQCGGEAELYEPRSESYGYWCSTLGVRCKSCKLSRGSYETEYYDFDKRKHVNKYSEAKYKAIALWNSREVKEWFKHG